MNVSYRWLLDMVPGLKLSPADLAEHLALRGAPVEGIVAPGAGLRDVVVGRVLTAGPHPNADRLSLCTVDGGDGVVSVVCGAPNVKGGAWYPFAPVGAVLPGDFKIKKAKIRGEVSEGMLCSPSELGIGDDHSGILEISGDFTPGQSFVEALGLDDATLDVEITANRGDLLSHMGVARELASEGGGQARLAEIPGDPALTLEHETHQEQVAHGEVSIRIEAPDLCPRYLGVVIRDVTVGPSPAWLQERLRGAGSRPINNVVDATNYVMMELGQPLHAFDLNKLRGSSIVVRRASAEENSFTTLDGEDRKITPDMLMICDADRHERCPAGVRPVRHEVDPGDTPRSHHVHGRILSLRARRGSRGNGTRAAAGRLTHRPDGGR
jgi:phenylalanyl-tRNA synthetase beta chain